jgi:preprotein translocase subunit SecY
LLIVVGVAMDTVQQIESQLIMRHYDGFLKKGRVRGRRG